MPAASAIPGLKRHTGPDGLTIWLWVASQVSRLTEGFRPRTVRLWQGQGRPSAEELPTIQDKAQQLSIDVQEWIYSRGRKVRSKRGLIYFVRVGDKVKIGFSQDVDRRMGELRTSSPFDLQLLLVLRGSAVTERAMHRRFKACRLTREWFRLEGPLAAFIERERVRIEGQNRTSESPPFLSESIEGRGEPQMGGKTNA